MRTTFTLLMAAVAGLAVPNVAAAQDVPQPAEPDGCQIIFDTTEETEALLQTYGLGFAGFETLCPLLRDAGMGVAADGGDGLVADRRYAMVQIRLYDLETRTRGWQSVTATSMAEDLPEQSPERLPVDSIDTALQAIAEQPASVMASVGEEVARMRILAASPPPAAPPPAAECSVRFGTSDEFRALINTWTDVSLADEALCRRLEAAGAGIGFVEASGILTDRTYGWVKIGLFDIATEISAPYRSTTFTMMANNEPDGGVEAMRGALLTGTQILADDQDVFFTSLAEEVAAMRAMLAPGEAAVAD